MDIFSLIIIGITAYAVAQEARKAYVKTHQPKDPIPSDEHIAYLVDQCESALSQLSDTIETNESFHLFFEDVEKFRVAVHKSKFNKNADNLKVLFDNMMNQMKPKPPKVEMAPERTECDYLCDEAIKALDHLESKMEDAESCDTTEEDIIQYRVLINEAHINDRKETLMRLIEDILRESNDIDE